MWYSPALSESVFFIVVYICCFVVLDIISAFVRPRETL